MCNQLVNQSITNFYFIIVNKRLEEAFEKWKNCAMIVQFYFGQKLQADCLQLHFGWELQADRLQFYCGQEL